MIPRPNIWMENDGITMDALKVSRPEALFVGHLLNTKLNFCTAIPPSQPSILYDVGFEPCPIGELVKATLKFYHTTFDKRYKR